MKYLLPLVALVLIGCTTRRGGAGFSDEVQRRSGEFTLHSDEMKGSGSIVFREDRKHAQLFFYSPFGQKIAQLSRVGDSIETVSRSEKLSPVSIEQAVVIPGVLSIPSVTMGELFSLLSGEMPPFLDSLVEQSGNVESNNAESSAVLIKKRRGSIREIKYSTDEYGLTLESPRQNHFREIKLELGRRNYFRIRYE